MGRVVVIGAGFAGIAAAAAAAKTGQKVLLLERMDRIGGVALMAGQMKSNGKLTAREEARAMGCGEMIDTLDSLVLYDVGDIPELDLRDFAVYDVIRAEGALFRMLKRMNVQIRLKARVIDVVKKAQKIEAVKLDDGSTVEGEAFVEATGSTGGMEWCIKYGHGCCMCVVSCPTFGSRVSVAGKAGVPEVNGLRADGKIGVMSSAFTLVRESLSKDLLSRLEEKGYLIIPLPPEAVDLSKIGTTAVSVYAREVFIKNLVMVDNGFPKVLVQSYMPLEKLRKVPGFEDAIMLDPYAGGVGNSIRYIGLAPRDNTFKVEGMDNLFCAGEKAGLHIGVEGVMMTGILAGHNGARCAVGKEPIQLPRTTVIGDYVAYVRERLETPDGIRQRYEFGGGAYFERMKQQGLYSRDPGEVRKRIEKEGLTGIFAQKL